MARLTRFGERMVEALPALEGYARKLAGGDSERAADLLQDSLLRIWEKRRTFKAGGNFKGWARRVMHNVNANLARSFSRKGSRLVFGAVDVELFGGPAEQEVFWDARAAGLLPAA